MVFAALVAFFATQNTGGVNIVLASRSISSIPVYLVVIGSMLIGFLVSWFISLFDSLSSILKIRGKNSAINNANNKISELEKRNNELQIENSNLKGRITEMTPSIGERIRQKVNLAT